MQAVHFSNFATTNISSQATKYLEHSRVFYLCHHSVKQSLSLVILLTIFISFPWFEDLFTWRKKFVMYSFHFHSSSLSTASSGKPEIVCLLSFFLCRHIFTRDLLIELGCHTRTCTCICSCTVSGNVCSCRW